MRFAIYGIGGFGREIAPLAYKMASEYAAMQGQKSASAKDLVVFVDDAENRPSFCNGLRVIGFDDLVSLKHQDRAVIVAVGDGRTREKIEGRCTSTGLTIGTLIAPSARILTNNDIASGTVICDFVTITSNVKIGRSFQGNLYSYVAHDCIIGDYVTFAPRVCCNGNIHIGDHAYIGTGAIFTQGSSEKPLLIGEGALVGMGAVVTKSVDPYTVVVGNPATPVRTLQRPR